MSRNRKTTTCPTCCPDGPYAIFNRDWAWDDKAEEHFEAWVCSNCGHANPIKRRAPKPHHINKHQQNAIDFLRDHLPSQTDPERYEWKRWDIETTDYGVVWLTCEHGMINDEGTLASVIARDYWHICITTGGKIKYMTKPKWFRTLKRY